LERNSSLGKSLRTASLVRQFLYHPQHELARLTLTAVVQMRAYGMQGLQPPEG
jgi:hypothetical protein